MNPKDALNLIGLVALKEEEIHAVFDLFRCLETVYDFTSGDTQKNLMGTLIIELSSKIKKLDMQPVLSFVSLERA